MARQSAKSGSQSRPRACADSVGSCKIIISTEAEMTEKPAVRISYDDKGHKGRFVARISGIDGEGELTISKVSDVLVIADHTFVPDTLRGTGAALALVEALIADARAKSYRVMPLCPFVRAQSLKHPEWTDVIQR